MPDCRIIFCSVPEGPPYYANGPYRLEGRCEVHNMSMAGVCSQLPNQDVMCPIGRIEKATEEGLAKLAAASR